MRAASKFARSSPESHLKNSSSSCCPFYGDTGTDLGEMDWVAPPPFLESKAEHFLMAKNRENSLDKKGDSCAFISDSYTPPPPSTLG